MLPFLLLINIHPHIFILVLTPNHIRIKLKFQYVKQR
jgi:hypothetical protein